MNVRKGVKKDWMGIVEIENQSFSTPWSSNAIKESFDNPLMQYWVVEADNKILGYIGVLHVLDEGQITNVAVHQEYRRLGIATVLIEQVKDWSKEDKIQQLILEVRTGNEAAKKLYTQQGFKVLGTRKNYYTKPVEDGLIMVYTGQE